MGCTQQGLGCCGPDGVPHSASLDWLWRGITPFNPVAGFTRYRLVQMTFSFSAPGASVEFICSMRLTRSGYVCGETTYSENPAGFLILAQDIVEGGSYLKTYGAAGATSVGIHGDSLGSPDTTVDVTYELSDPVTFDQELQACLDALAPLDVPIGPKTPRLVNVYGRSIAGDTITPVLSGPAIVLTGLSASNFLAHGVAAGYVFVPPGVNPRPQFTQYPMNLCPPSGPDYIRAAFQRMLTQWTLRPLQVQGGFDSPTTFRIMKGRARAGYPLCQYNARFDGGGDVCHNVAAYGVDTDFYPERYHQTALDLVSGAGVFGGGGSFTEYFQRAERDEYVQSTLVQGNSGALFIPPWPGCCNPLP